MYRLLHITVENFFEVSSTLQAMCNLPNLSMSSMTRGVGFFAGDSTFLYTGLGGGPWLQLTFAEIVMLRVLEDMHLFRFPCAGMLLSDLS